nr:MAG TPA: hypothetical protein [Caudoviricetes sp.]
MSHQITGFVAFPLCIYQTFNWLVLLIYNLLEILITLIILILFFFL